MSPANVDSSELLRSPFIAVRGSVSLPVGVLPASILSVLSNANPNMLVAVMSVAALGHARLRSRAAANVGGRLATVIAAEDLSIQSLNVALLSPSLLAACNKIPDSNGLGADFVVIERVAGVPPSIERVTVVSFLPSTLPSQTESSQIADSAKRALLQRSVAVGDVIAISLDSWLVVTNVAIREALDVREASPCLVPGFVDEGTDVALRAGGQFPEVSVCQRMRIWARSHWSRSLPPWEWGEYVEALEHCVHGRRLTPGPSVVGVVGLMRDVRDVVRCFSVARALFEFDGRLSNQKEFLETLARAELAAEGQDAIVFIHHADRLGVSLVDILEGQVLVEQTDSFLLGERGYVARQSRVVIVVGCENIDDLSANIRGLLSHEVEVEPASEAERRLLLAPVTQSELTRMTLGFARTEVLGLRRSYQEFGGFPAASEAVERFGKGKLTVSAGNVGWDDVGGLEDAKKEISQLVQLPPSNSSSSSSATSRRVGILLHGPPGTGKTLIAKAVAGECGCSFISVKGPELLDMYVGESERNVREVFSRAELAAPCVVFFDEIDALAPARGRGGSDGGGVADRVVSQLLSEIDGAASRRGVFIIAATNRPDLVDSSILRPGRFDKLVYVPTPENRSAQKRVLSALIRKFTLSDDVDIDETLARVPEPPILSGADLYALAAEAWLSAARRKIDELEPAGEEPDPSRGLPQRDVDSCCEDLLDRARHEEQLAGAEVLGQRVCADVESTDAINTGPGRIASSDTPEDQVLVTNRDFLSAASRLKPSLRPEELASYSQLQK